jgi:hypothetical protein
MGQESAPDPDRIRRCVRQSRVDRGRGGTSERISDEILNTAHRPGERVPVFAVAIQRCRVIGNSRVVEDHPGAGNLSCDSDDKASPRRFDYWQSDRFQVVEFQDTAHLGLLTRPRLRALLRPERIIDPRQPVEGKSFQH